MRNLPSIGVIVALLASACGGDETGAGGSTSSSGGSSGWVPGASPPLPQVVSLGGQVLANPKVQPIVYASDPHAADVEAFVAELASTPYWATVTSEYGVGPLSALPIVERAEAPPSKLSLSQLSGALTANTGVGAPWGETSAEIIYLFVLPTGTVVDNQGPCCENFDGFHEEANVNGIDVPYAVVCSCPGFDGPSVDDVQQITIAMSHEIVEAATDPHVWTNPAYAQADDDSLIYTIVTGGEVADMCGFEPDSWLIPEGSKFMVQRSWSNAAARVGKDPCLPARAGAPFFTAVPVLTEALVVKGVPFFGKGVKIPVGEKRTVDVQLYSDAPTAAPWTVEALDFGDFFGGPKSLALSLDRTTGQDGDVLKLTIEVLAADTMFGAEPFFLVSRQGEAGSLTIGGVGSN